MISFSTEFTINPSISIDDILKVIRTWITGSPNSNISEEDFPGISEFDEFFLEEENEKIMTGFIKLDDHTLAGLNYIKNDRITIGDKISEIEWNTTIVVSHNALENIISVQVEPKSINAPAYIPKPRKPYIIKQLIETFGGGMDGDIPVSNTPIIFTEEDANVDAAAELLLGKGKNNLPIIYLSSTQDGTPLIDAKKLAKQVAGTAHVMVEPSRKFSFLLNKKTLGTNVYDGTVGVYWPHSIFVKKYFLTNELNTSEKIFSKVCHDIYNTISHRRHRTHCTWSNLKENIAKKRLETLRQSGSTKVQEYIDNFDAEISAKEENIASMQAELYQLREDIKRFSEKSNENTPIIFYGKEIDFYRDEIKCIIIDALTSFMDAYTLKDSRRSHVLNDIITQNRAPGECAEINRKLKELLSNYSSMDSKTKSELIRMGFDISDDGKHHKVIFRGDGRYTFSLSKTSSDNRGSKNFVSDVIKKIL